MSQTKLDILVNILRDAPDEVFIQPHNVPDPDAIASSLGCIIFFPSGEYKNLQLSTIRK